MEKETARLMLIDYLNGHLEPEQTKVIEGMLAQHADLRTEASALRREMHLMRSGMRDPYVDARLSGISEGVMRRIRQRKGSSISTLSPAWRSYLRLAAAVFVVVIGLVAFFVLRPVERPAPEDRVATGPAETEKPEVIRLSLQTSDPTVRIYWTMSKDFEPITQGD